MIAACPSLIPSLAPRLQGKRKSGAMAKATIVIEAQFFFGIGPFSVHDGSILGRYSPSLKHGRKENIKD
jgi:hypothetical protein